MSTRSCKNVQFELAKFMSKRDLYYAKIENLFNLSSRICEPDVAIKFSSGYAGFLEIWEKFHKMLKVVNDLNFQISPDYKPNYDLLDKAEEFRCSILGAAKRLQSRDDTAGPNSSSFKLPKISLSEFNGDITQWPLFFEKFNTIIHENQNLDELAKMHYLLGALKGKAQDVCVGLTPIAANYPILLNALKAKYNNKRILADTYFHLLIDLKPLVQESATGLSQLLIRFDTAVKSLQGLHLPDLTDYFLATLLLIKIDPQTRREFETSQHEQIPTYQEILNFLHRQIDALSQIQKKCINSSKTYSALSGHQPSAAKAFVSQARSNSHAHANLMRNSSLVCPICTQSHQTFRCQSFSKLSPVDRLKLVQERNLCLNCLSDKHTLRACNSESLCKLCRQPHHTLVHLGNSSELSSASKSSPQVDQKPTCSFLLNFQATLNSGLNSTRRVTILPTAVVWVDTPVGEKKARFLIDSGSHKHFISHDYCKKFHLPFNPKIVPLEGIGNVSFQAIGETTFTIKSLCDTKLKFEISALVTKKITLQLPTESVTLKQLECLKDLPLADREFYRPGPIDGILGIQLFGKILEGEKIFGSDQSSQAIKTTLGYIVTGDVSEKISNKSLKSAPVSTFCIFDNQDLSLAVQRFWELEKVPNISKPTEEESLCEKLFQDSTTRINGKTYCLQLPFKEFPPMLGDSRQNAERRFFSLERKFKKNPEFRVQYAAVIRDYLDQGHLSLVPPRSDSPNEVHFIPHFAVLKESASTPLRIVFDASAKTTNSRSLNDVIFTGPKLQKDIVQILLSFRIFPIALVADVKQMYRNIMVAERHRCFQRILWRNSPDEILRTYELNCVVFGLTAAPYLALRTVHQLAMDESNRFPVASQLADRHMYIDDLVVSLKTVPQAVEAYEQLVDLFTAGGFRLTKWVSNSPGVLERIPIEDRLAGTIDFSDSSKIREVVKVLGLKWDSTSDLFSFATSSILPIFTKRGILSVVARIWDPLGFLAPVTLHAKVLIKDLWRSELDWDDELPLDLKTRWRQFVEELPCLQKIQIPRQLGIASNSSVMLIGFADSSEKGYGAVVYIRPQSPNRPADFLYAKSRVAPQKTISLPRLELCAAVLLSQLMKICSEILAPEFSEISKFACTDSSVTLSWIKNPHRKRDTFVAHRITAIDLVLSPQEWYHVRSQDNAADCISRGLSPAQFLSRDTWFHGPAWLSLDRKDWPIQNESSRSSSDLTLEPSPSSNPISVLVNVKGDDWLPEFLSRFSTLKKLINVTVYLLRFGKRLPLKAKIELSDIEKAEQILIRQVQQYHFSDEISRLGRNLLSSSKLRTLSPFLHQGILCVGRRLSNSRVSYDTQHPILLPKSSPLSSLIVDHCHRSNLHTGPTLVLALIRQRFWILSARSLVRKRIRACNWCFKRNPQPNYPPMADLPAARVQEAKPFLHTGVDYAGPFQVSISRRRGIKSQKAYLCLFICLITKAVHLELASSLSSNAFLDCFRRFISRRGPVGVLYSDQGTNFIGAKAQLDKLYAFVQSDDLQIPLQTHLKDHRIVWRYNPPHAPHFGGLWESNIRSVKTHLSKVIGSQILSYEEFTTVLTQIEALLNSRPLAPLSTDPTDPAPSKTLRSRKELLDCIIQSFWRRWHKEYLTSLQVRSKWNTPVNSLTAGTLVLIKNESVPPLQWPLAIVEDVHPGKDGVVRVASVRVGQSTYQRPVAKLCPLPTQ